MSADTVTFDLARSACEAYALDHAELGALLLRLSQSGRKHLETLEDDRVGTSEKGQLDPYFSHILPEISARLMAQVDILPSRRRPELLPGLSASDLRKFFIDTFQSVAFRRFIDAVTDARAEMSGIRDIDLCLAPAVNGNIAVIALDRICPPDKAPADTLGSLMRLTAAIRGVKQRSGRWTPEFARTIVTDLGWNGSAEEIIDASLERAQEIGTGPASREAHYCDS